ncbi:DUF4870 domain-containing protein, partial [Staphylococcus epidermidis]|uniref:DUF4870 domain-containing protein n=1 Tax=Staphylococcus epidermidis TaxID=1282 RepID=UPI0011A5DB6A
TIQNHQTQHNPLIPILIYLLTLFTPIIPPFIISLLKPKHSPLLHLSPKTYLNYFISYTIYSTLPLISIFIILP